MAVPTVTLDTPKPGRLGNSPFGVLSGTVNVSAYDTAHPEVKVLTGQFLATGPKRVSPAGVSSLGYLIRWDDATKSFKAYVPGAATVTRGTPPAASAITPGASPYTYTNNDGVPEVVTITGGTTSHITVTRGAFTSADLYTVTPGHVLLYPGDAVNVTYSSVPTMEKLPDGVLTAAVAAAEVEATNGTNVGTFDFVAVGQLG